MFGICPKLQNVYVQATPTYKSGANTSNMWSSSGTNHFTIWDYETNGNPLNK